MEKLFCYNSPIGVLEVTIRDDFISGVKFIGEVCQKFGGKPSNPLPNPTFYEFCRQADEYFSGKRKSFELKLNPEGTDFQKRVWAELLKIPYGVTRSYRDIARNIGSPNAQRAVGAACNKNPILILIPCHRVVGKNGDLTGFACGVEVKRKLLMLEEII